VVEEPFDSARAVSDPVEHSPVVSLDAWRAHPIFGDAQPTDPEKWLCHYTTLTSAAAIALTGQFMLSPLSTLNDPQESTRRPMTTLTFDVRGKPPSNVSTEERMEFERIMDKLRDQVRIGCFTKWATA
jgi:hypothetical protein